MTTISEAGMTGTMRDTDAVMPEFRVSEISGTQGGRASPERLWSWVPPLGLAPEAGMTTISEAGMTATMRDTDAVMPEYRVSEISGTQAGRASPERL
jgi:hypothetical protein